MQQPTHRPAAIALIALTLFAGCRPGDPDDHRDSVAIDTLAQHTVPVVQTTPDAKPGAKNILLGLLLDTSNSMDGLIDQAKAQLWDIVNKLSSAQCAGERPTVRVALYEYGNDGISGRMQHVRQVMGFTTNMDEVSKALFALRTNGGEEYCGAVIARSVGELDWGASENDLRMLVIAGNEPFTQGPVSFGQACEQARRKGIVVNTIYCGEHEEGINTAWQAGALAAAGDYFSIDHNAVTMQIASPYDQELAQLEAQWNANGMYYGKQGSYASTNRTAQDENASELGFSSTASRRSYKMANKHLDRSWDLTEVESEELDAVIKSTEKSTLPEAYRGLDQQQIKGEVLKRKAQKSAIQQRIAELTIARERYVAEHANGATTNQLQNALLTSIAKHAGDKGLSFTDQPVQPAVKKEATEKEKLSEKMPGA